MRSSNLRGLFSTRGNGSLDRVLFRHHTQPMSSFFLHAEHRRVLSYHVCARRSTISSTLDPSPAARPTMGGGDTQSDVSRSAPLRRWNAGSLFGGFLGALCGPFALLVWYYHRDSTLFKNGASPTTLPPSQQTSLREAASVIEDHLLNSEGKGTNRVPTLGGPFTMTNCHTKNIVSERDVFLGRWTLLYFGFSKCAEICPSTLSFMVDVVKEWDATRKEGRTREVVDGNLSSTPTQFEANTKPSTAPILGNDYPQQSPNGSAPLVVVPIQICFVSVDFVRDDVDTLKTFLDRYQRALHSSSKDTPSKDGAPTQTLMEDKSFNPSSHEAPHKDAPLTQTLIADQKIKPLTKGTPPTNHATPSPPPPIHNSLLGLVGTKEQVLNITSAWRVYFTSYDDPPSIIVHNESTLPTEEQHKKEQQEYTDWYNSFQLDHSAAIYLIGPDGKMKDFFFKELGVHNVVDKLGLHEADAYGLLDHMS